ncbi:MAG: hypothetical protein MUC29_07315 [Pyrinomonadaceae bacterium]|jgi:hypothetical protein|nr:hypothetical protein [Pyrinomonadaceae bacterium]
MKLRIAGKEFEINQIEGNKFVLGMPLHEFLIHFSVNELIDCAIDLCDDLTSLIKECLP